MKSFLPILLLFLHAGLSAADAPTPAPAAPTPNPPALHSPPQPAPRSWLGLKLAKPDETTTAHLPNLPAGMGFLIRSVDPNGPAEISGIRPLDVIWKLGDQWLVNESQLAALLRLSSPGEVVSLAGFRAGQPMTFQVKLGTAPARPSGIPPELADAAILPDECGGPWRVVNTAEKLASYSTRDGRAEVRKVNDTYQVKITGPNQEILYDGELPNDPSLSSIPQAWHRRVLALRRGLDHALNGNIPTRQPRPRVVSPTR